MEALEFVNLNPPLTIEGVDEGVNEDETRVHVSKPALSNLMPSTKVPPSSSTDDILQNSSIPLSSSTQNILRRSSIPASPSTERIFWSSSIPPSTSIENILQREPSPPIPGPPVDEHSPKPSHCILLLFPKLTDKEWENFKSELKLLSHFAWPVSVAEISRFFLDFARVILVGHLSDTAEMSAGEFLSSALLATLFIEATGYAVGLGLCTAVETLCGQAYGAQNYKMVAAVLQRSVIVNTLSLIPVGLVWYFSENLFISFGQDPKIAHYAALFIRYSLPGYWPWLFYMCLLQYLQAQGQMISELNIGFGVNIMNCALAYIIMFPLKMGFIGAAVSASVANWCAVFITLLYIRLRKLHAQTWFGILWSELFKGWGEILKIAFPGTFMLCAESWLGQVIMFLAGSINPLHLTAATLVMELSYFFYYVVSGVGEGLSTRVSNLLGANQPQAARFASQIGMLLGSTIIAFDCVLILTFRHSIPRILTDERDVSELVAHLLPIFTLCHIFDGLQIIMGAIIRGMGGQKIGVFIYILGGWSCIPLAAYFAFNKQLNSTGLMWGWSIGLFNIALGLGIRLYRTNWKKEAEAAGVRTQREEEEAVLQKSYHGPGSTPPEIKNRE